MRCQALLVSAALAVGSLTAGKRVRQASVERTYEYLGEGDCALADGSSAGSVAWKKADRFEESCAERCNDRDECRGYVWKREAQICVLYFDGPLALKLSRSAGGRCMAKAAHVARVDPVPSSAATHSAGTGEAPAPPQPTSPACLDTPCSSNGCPGKGTKYVHVVVFDVDSARCVEKVHGGMERTRNNFRTFDECVDTCINGNQEAARNVPESAEAADEAREEAIEGEPRTHYDEDLQDAVYLGEDSGDDLQEDASVAEFPANPELRWLAKRSIAATRRAEFEKQISASTTLAQTSSATTTTPPPEAEPATAAFSDLGLGACRLRGRSSQTSTQHLDFRGGEAGCARECSRSSDCYGYLHGDIRYETGESKVCVLYWSSPVELGDKRVGRGRCMAKVPAATRVGAGDGERRGRRS